jgi:hypothetical protein
MDGQANERLYGMERNLNLHDMFDDCFARLGSSDVGMHVLGRYCEIPLSLCFDFFLLFFFGLLELVLGQWFLRIEWMYVCIVRDGRRDRWRVYSLHAWGVLYEYEYEYEHGNYLQPKLPVHLVVTPRVVSTSKE